MGYIAVPGATPSFNLVRAKRDPSDEAFGWPMLWCPKYHPTTPWTIWGENPTMGHTGSMNKLYLDGHTEKQNFSYGRWCSIQLYNYATGSPRYYAAADAN